MDLEPAFEADKNTLVINPLIYAEISIRFASIEDLEEVLDPLFFRKDPLPWEAAFLAGKVFLKYRKKGGRKGTRPQGPTKLFDPVYCALIDGSMPPAAFP